MDHLNATITQLRSSVDIGCHDLAELDIDQRSRLLYDLANALSERFNRGSQRSDLDEAVSFQRQALELRPTGHTNRFEFIMALGILLWQRLGQGAQANSPNDVDEAINLCTQATELIPLDDPRQSDCLKQRANAFFA